MVILTILSQGEHQLMEKLTQTFSQVSNLESEMMSECEFSIGSICFKNSFLCLVPFDEETLASKFVWGEV